ncbi:hypothetical protein C1H76_2325 [Elsinoe australis]|uniref:Uncharacterized protein n=1 Tax=Elsinoe australis TaxID=40998 RepID=A0A4U7B7D9_9PEZI|nr:hypothetical protein C1H76_2325 [Elsinoe australis]
MLSLYVILFLLCAISLVAPLLWRRFKYGRTDKTLEADPYKDIAPLVDFDWKKEAPIKLRPFKPKYHLTMSIEQTALSDLIAMDNTYESRIKLRRSITTSHPHETLASLPTSEPMVHELYTWLFTTYLPLRFPTMFTLRSSPKGPSQPYNLVLKEAIPFPPPSSPLTCLNLISSHIDTDFLLLAPRPVATYPKPPSSSSENLPSSSEEKYHLLAFANCFPSGFSPREKLGLPLNAIHGPVPGYPAKLEKSMDRFFARLPPGQIVKRANWTVTTAGEQLFCLKGNHFHEEDGVGEEGRQRRLDAEIRRQREAVEIAQCRLRTERQTLHRLPGTGALVFAFKSYLYGLDEVKGEEGMGEALAEAIEGFEKGSVPEMKVYKRQVVWGDKVCEYLRS